MANKVKVLTSRRITQIEDDLYWIEKQMRSLREDKSNLYSELKSLIKKNGGYRTSEHRISKKRSEGTLDASAICRHFGCSMQFLSKFRKYGKTSEYIARCKPPKREPELIDLDERSKK